MNTSHEALITRLVLDISPGQNRLRVTRQAVVWLILGTLIAASLLYVVAPYRPGFMEQLLTVPRFSLEMLLGVACIAGIGVVVMKMGVPGATGVFDFVLIFALTLLWISSNVLSIFYPTMDLGMLGMRAHCWQETLIYGLPVMILGFWLVSRGYVFNWIPAGFLTGLVSGFIPGLIMQIACMYDAKHALMAHIGPAFLLAVLGGIAGYGLVKWRDGH